MVRVLLLAVPLVLMAAVVWGVVNFGPSSQDAASQTPESLVFERTALSPGLIEVTVRNDAWSPVTISQVLVNDALWEFTASSDQLDRLEAATIAISYPWEEGEPIAIEVLTSTGAKFVHSIDFAVVMDASRPGAGWSYVMVGFLVGILPVALGLIWVAELRHVSASWIEAATAGTAGIMVFLLVETTAAGLRLAAEAAESLNAVGLFILSALLMYWLVNVSGQLIRQDGSTGAPQNTLRSAYILALGIGLHNAGEGFAIGSAITGGELVLGTSLIVGFMIHNLTEGFAIAVPASRARIEWPHYVALAVFAGCLTIPGVFVGGMASANYWAVVIFGVATGAIGQVVRELLGWLRPAMNWRLGAAFVGGFGLMYLLGLLIV